MPTIQKYLENKKQENKESEDYERRLAEYQKRKEEEDEADLAEQDQRDSSERDARAQDDMGGHDEDGRPPDKPQPHKRKGHGKKKTKGEMEKEEMMDQMNMNKVDPITRAKKGAKGERRVSGDGSRSNKSLCSHPISPLSRSVIPQPVESFSSRTQIPKTLTLALQPLGHPTFSPILSHHLVRTD